MQIFNLSTLLYQNLDIVFESSLSNKNECFIKQQIVYVGSVLIWGIKDNYSSKCRFMFCLLFLEKCFGDIMSKT